MYNSTQKEPLLKDGAVFVNNSSRIKYRVLWFNQDIVFLVSREASAFPIKITMDMLSEHYEIVRDAK